MAQLTEAQKAAKRERDKAYRARKAAKVETESLGPVVNEDGTPTAVTIEILTGKKPEPTVREQILRTEKGAEFISPRGGMLVTIVQKYRNDGARLLTSDGRQIKRDAPCDHELPENYTGVYYEIVGGPFDGTHGWVHRARGCNRPYQVG